MFTIMLNNNAYREREDDLDHGNSHERMNSHERINSHAPSNSRESSNGPEPLNSRGSVRSHVLAQQLEREITCLTRQLERLKLLDGTSDSRTESTYQDMINSRKEILSELR